MERYAVIDQFGNEKIQDLFNDEFEAEYYASRLWDSYTATEKSQRTKFAVVLGHTDNKKYADDMYINTDNAKIIKNYL